MAETIPVANRDCLICRRLARHLHRNSPGARIVLRDSFTYKLYPKPMRNNNCLNLTPVNYDEGFTQRSTLAGAFNVNILNNFAKSMKLLKS